MNFLHVITYKGTRGAFPQHLPLPKYFLFTDSAKRSQFHKVVINLCLRFRERLLKFQIKRALLKPPILGYIRSTQIYLVW